MAEAGDDQQAEIQTACKSQWFCRVWEYPFKFIAHIFLSANSGKYLRAFGCLGC
jgi:hypothetical protein